jgi:hypothetical protein
MPKKADPNKISTRIIKSKRPNGDTYVYERRSRYIQEKRYEVSIGKKLLGVIKKGSTEMTPTRSKRPSAKKPSEPAAESKQMGLSEILDWIGRESGIDEDVRAAFGSDKGGADKVISLARYATATVRQPTALFNTWQMSHNVPYEDPIGEDSVRNLYNYIGCHADIVQTYFKSRASRMPDGDCTIFDSTTMSTDSLLQPEARKGFNKAGDGKDTIKYASFLSMKTRQPIAFAREPGNIPDVLAMRSAIKSLDFLGLRAKLLVTDNGYCSDTNILDLCRSGVHFLTMERSNVNWVKNEIEPKISDLMLFTNILKSDKKVHGITLKVRHEFSWKAKYTTKKYESGDERKHAYNLYIHAYRSEDSIARDQAKLDSRLCELKEQLESGVKDFTAGAQAWIDKFLVVSHDNGRTVVEPNKAEYEKACRYLGVFVLVSNSIKDCEEALVTYRRREEIEAHFRLGKQKGRLSHPHVWHPQTLEGRLFCMFVALGYETFLQERMRQAEEKLGKENGDPHHDLKGTLEAENKLRAWMQNSTFEEILTWFDCVREVTVKTKTGKLRWSTALVNRDRMFLKTIGYPVRDNERAF